MKHARWMVRACGMLLVALFALVPPWRMSSLGPEKQETESRFLGYRPLWNPPSEEVELGEGVTEVRYRVDLVRLGIQLAAVVVIVNVGLILMKRRSSGVSER